MEDDEWFGENERPTLVTCMSCGGRDKIVEQRSDGSYRMHNCRWCNAGAMTLEQQKVFEAYVKTRRSDS